jgi:anti-repressor protein
LQIISRSTIGFFNIGKAKAVFLLPTNTIKNTKVMNELKIFKNEEFREVRTMLVNGEPYFVGKDVASVLGYSNTRNAILQHVDSEDVLKQGVPDSQGFTQQTTLINESGLYSLIFGSKLESAKSFKRWVTSEVLPAIRKTGSYNLPSYQIENPIQRAEAWIQEEKERQALKEQAKQLTEENKNLEAQIEEDLPKVIFAMAVTESKRSCLVAELAKIICQNGMEVGQNRLFKWLRKRGYLGTKGEYYNQPMQRWVEAGMFEIKKRTITKPNGDLITVSTPLVTGKGQVYLVNKFLKEYVSK